MLKKRLWDNGSGNWVRNNINYNIYYIKYYNIAVMGAGFWVGIAHFGEPDVQSPSHPGGGI
jgi:hypothetical protein